MNAIDRASSVWNKWEAQREEIANAAAPCWVGAVADIPSMEGRQPRVFTLNPTDAGIEKSILKLGASYALMSSQGVQIILLGEPIRPNSPWSKFNVLHEAGHLRNPRRAAYLVARNGWIFPCCALAIVELVLWSMQSGQRDLIEYAPQVRDRVARHHALDLVDPYTFLYAKDVRFIQQCRSSRSTR